ncbi:MAG: hypothetical protein U0V49_01300 [Saprospiraceae bacterium]
MKNIVFLSLIYLTISCKPSYNIAALKESGCGDYRFGMIECKRLLKDEDKDLLEKKGLLIQDHLFDQVYQGIWYKNWDKINLKATPIRKLKQYQISEKLSEGIQLALLKDDTRTCNLLIQVITPLDQSFLTQYGKILNHKDLLYRLETQYKNIEPIVQHPCIKHVSVLKLQDFPDKKD